MKMIRLSSRSGPLDRLFCLGVGVLSALAAPSVIALEVTRLNPPSGLFTYEDPTPPIISRFLTGQRFDLQATLKPDAGQSIVKVEFWVAGQQLTSPVTLSPTTTAATVGSTSAVLRAYSHGTPGVHVFEVKAWQSNGATVTAQGNFEIVGIEKVLGTKVQPKNLIIYIGDGMGIAHRTAARLMLKGVSQGKSLGALAMDAMPHTALVSTHSLNSIVTDSSPGAACYATGNKANNNQHGVFPDDTLDNFDNPRVELIGEYLHRTQGKSLGIVTTSDVFDATPGSFGTHTQSRAAGTGICDMYLDEASKAGLSVLLGGGRKWFLPAGTPGSQRSNNNDYVLPAELATGWGVPSGQLDANRDLIADFESAGFTYVATHTELAAIPANTDRLLGLFAYSNMNVALDKIGKRRGTSTVVDDYLFPDQPMLDEMTAAAIQVLSRNPKGFVLMVEAASIDKQAHAMDTERWILDTIEFDHAIRRGTDYAAAHEDTLVYVTADHECAGVNIIGASGLVNAALQQRAQSGGGAAQLRNGVVATYEGAGFPQYQIRADGYPATTDPDYKMLIGYAANADRYEDWLTNSRPLRDSQQPLNTIAPLNTYPSAPLNRDVAGRFLVTGQVSGSSAVHTASDVPLSASGPGASLFAGTMDNTDVFFLSMQALLGGAPVPPPGLAKKQ